MPFCFLQVRLALFLGMVSASNAFAQSGTWVFFSGDDPKECSDICISQYIDPFSKASYGLRQEGMKTLTEYSEGAQSATTFGHSEVETVIFDCQNSKMKSNGTVWYSDKQARGKITKTFPAEKNWSAIRVDSIPLFAKLCSTR